MPYNDSNNAPTNNIKSLFRLFANWGMINVNFVRY
jgi:hypothetical protein